MGATCAPADSTPRSCRTKRCRSALHLTRLSQMARLRCDEAGDPRQATLPPPLWLLLIAKVACGCPWDVCGPREAGNRELNARLVPGGGWRAGGVKGGWLPRGRLVTAAALHSSSQPPWHRRATPSCHEP